jgi:hypothetical protein
MTRGRSRKRYRTPRKSTDENDHSPTGQGAEIATPPARRTSLRRGTEMNPSNPLQTEESGIGNDIYYVASAVSPNANHQVQKVPLFTVDRTDEPVPNSAQTLEDQQFEDPESQELCLQCLTPVWHRDIRVFARQLEEYSNEALQMPIIKYKEFLCSLLTALPCQNLMLHRHWRINNLRIQIAKNYFFSVLHMFGTETFVFLLGNRKSIAMKPIHPL